MTSDPTRPSGLLPTLGLATFGFAGLGLAGALPASAQPAAPPAQVPEVSVSGDRGASYQGDIATRPAPRVP